MGETAVVTGVSRGIGLAIAKTLAARGDRVIGLSRTPPQDAGDIDFASVDLLDPAQVNAVFADLNSRYEIDILVNNAGISVPAPMQEASLEDLQLQVDVNMRATLQCTQAVTPGMIARNYGRIVNISSRSALGKPRLTSYGATKAAVIGFTRGWALEVARKGITVNCICPGPIETDMFAQNFPPGSPGREMILNEVAMRRSGRPEEIAAAVVWLCSDDAAFVVGHAMVIDGGQTV